MLRMPTRSVSQVQYCRTPTYFEELANLSWTLRPYHETQEHCIMVINVTPQDLFGNLFLFSGSNRRAESRAESQAGKYT